MTITKAIKTPSKTISVDNKIVGIIKQDVFVTHRRSQSDIIWSVPGFSFRIDVLEELDEEGIRSIRVVDMEVFMIYEAKLVDFQKYGMHIEEDGVLNLWLPLPHWHLSIFNNKGQ